MGYSPHKRESPARRAGLEKVSLVEGQLHESISYFKRIGRRMQGAAEVPKGTDSATGSGHTDSVF
jgi:hypothetical protein